MSLNLRGILDAVTDHALTTGLFDTVNRHEPKSAPGNGLTAAVGVDSIGPATGQSGLTASSALVVLTVQLFTSMLQQPYDDIDLNMVAAVDTLFDEYSGAFTLGGLVRDVDLLGQAGTPLSGKGGYINQDGKVFRVFTISLPLIVNDVWSQAA